ncbi:MAG: hypothetical protein AAF628_01145 [Planctomycetota bacterium]
MTAPPPPVTGDLHLQAVHFGKLVDVYGLRTTSAGAAVELYRADVLVGPDIEDERANGSTRPDEEVLYDFVGTDPDDLTPRLVITREIDSAEFRAAFAAIDDEVTLVTPASVERATGAPFTVVARNAALRLTFDRDVGVTEDFFVERGPEGQVLGLKNTEAVQLLRIQGDPSAPGAFAPIAARVLPRGREILLDPVLLGAEGPRYVTPNNAAGLPEAPNQAGANIRLALALDGPLAMPRLRADRTGPVSGRNLNGADSVVRDFRSGNRDDDTPGISQGFLRDPEPPRLIGEILTRLERVDRVDERTLSLTLFKAGRVHDLDRGDVIRLFAGGAAVPVAVTEILREPSDDDGRPGVAHVRVRVRRVVREVAGGAAVDVFEDWDPSGPDNNAFWQQFAGGGTRPPPYPADPVDREAWLVAHAPRAVVVAEFTAQRLSPAGASYGDDPRHFLTFSPAPIVAPGVAASRTENVSPFAAVVVRFSKPIDMRSVRPLDTLFFATRNLLDQDAIDTFIRDQNIDPSAFVHAKFVTPHLVAAQAFDESGSQTAVRLQPTLGFYLDQRMRDLDDARAFEDKEFRYYLHLLAGRDGIRDLAGNALDLQAQTEAVDAVIVPFSLDTRSLAGVPRMEDNRVVTVARRFQNPDEDEHPSYYARGFDSPAWAYPESYSDYTEVPSVGPPNPAAAVLRDVFGAVVYLPDGTLLARPTTRITRATDDASQVPPPPQASERRWCERDTEVAPTAQAVFNQPLQNPLNQNGCRLQMVWREIDMTLSRSDPEDFNLDVEQMWWAPWIGEAARFDELDSVSLYLGHSERRPESCIDAVSRFPFFPNSGLVNRFANNFVRNFDLNRVVEGAVAPHPAFVDQPLRIIPSQAVSGPRGAYAYMPLPAFERPYFVWRDERVLLQGGRSGLGSDTGGGMTNYQPYILSPFLAGRGRAVELLEGSLATVDGRWDNRDHHHITARQVDRFTDGLVGAIALPLLADFQVPPDDPDRPASNPFRATGVNGWQVSLAATSSAQPKFRVFSSGGVVSGQAVEVRPGSQDWNLAMGSHAVPEANRVAGDNTVFWVMADYLKRMSVMTSGFVDVLDPHRVLAWPPRDPRLGPYADPFARAGAGEDVHFQHWIETATEELPAGTGVLAEFRGAGAVDEAAWAAAENGYTAPDPVSFPLDPFKAGDAHIRKFDDRSGPAGPRRGWTHYYNRNVTTYVADPNDLMDPEFTSGFAAPNETFRPSDLRYFNWRLVFTNNVDVMPPVAPRLDSFVVAYRLEDS